MQPTRLLKTNHCARTIGAHLNVRNPAAKRSLAVLCFAVATSVRLFGANVGDQVNVRVVNAAKGWTSIVPMNINNDRLTDLLSYNATTGMAEYSVATGVPGEQQLVKRVSAGTGWTSIVPMNINGDILTDLLWYNATSGAAAYSVATGVPGEQRVVKQGGGGAVGWTSIVPMNLDNDILALTDLLWYNKATGQAVYSIGTQDSNLQKVVKQVNAAIGWTSIVPMNLDNDSYDLTDLLCYNAMTGQAVYSIGTPDQDLQKVVKQVNSSIGWTSIVPMNLDSDHYGLTDLLCYSATTGLVKYSVGAGILGDQQVVREAYASPGWTSIVPMFLNTDDFLTDLLSYNSLTGKAVYSVNAYQPPPGPFGPIGHF